MNQITILSAEADQLVTVILADSSLLRLEFMFKPAIQRWIINVAHPLLTVNGMLLSKFPNLLRPWRNLIHFGLACSTSDHADPFDINDFSTGRVQMYVLNAAEVSTVETVLL